VRSCVIDGELIAAGKDGEPDFLALLHGRHVPVCVYGFDLLELDSRDLRQLPLEQRRARLKRLSARGKGKLLRFSDSFPEAAFSWPSAPASASRASCASGKMRPIGQGRAAAG
jgi:bifunctional non-homologous end joining protein LigD